MCVTGLTITYGDINKYKFTYSQECNRDGKELHHVCIVSHDGNNYCFRNGVLDNVTNSGEELSLLDIEGVTATYQSIIKNLDTYPKTICTRLEDGEYYSVNDEYICVYNLLRADKMRELYPDRTIYFQGKEYPKRGDASAR